MSSRRDLFFWWFDWFSKVFCALLSTSRSKSDGNPALVQAFREVISGSRGVVGRLLPLLYSNMVSDESGDLDLVGKSGDLDKVDESGNLDKVLSFRRPCTDIVSITAVLAASPQRNWSHCPRCCLELQHETCLSTHFSRYLCPRELRPSTESPSQCPQLPTVTCRYLQHQLATG